MTVKGMLVPNRFMGQGIITVKTVLTFRGEIGQRLVLAQFEGFSDQIAHQHGQRDAIDLGQADAGCYRAAFQVPH